MYFEAKVQGQKFLINVAESKDCWTVSLQPNGGDEEIHNISKSAFQGIDDAISFLFQNQSYIVSVMDSGTKYSVFTRGSYREISLFNDEMLLHESLKGGGSIGGSDSLTAGMPGKIVDILVKQGDEVQEGQPILIMEAMKMENEMKAAEDCKIKEIKVEKGQSVESGALLITFGE